MLGVKAEVLKNISICPKLLINAELYGLVLAPRRKKGHHQIWETDLQPLGPMFQHLLIIWGQFATLKCSKLALSFFDPDSKCKAGLNYL